jgi:hypothetical protein
MADHRVYRVKLTPEHVLERMRSCVGQCPYEVRVADRRFTLNETDFFAATLTGSLRDEEGVTCIDLRLSLQLLPTMIIAAFGMLALQGLYYTVVHRKWSTVTPAEIGEEMLGGLALAVIGVGLLVLAWRPRRRRAAAYWTFLDRLFADVKIGEEQL